MRYVITFPWHRALHCIDILYLHFGYTFDHVNDNKIFDRQNCILVFCCSFALKLSLLWLDFVPSPITHRLTVCTEKVTSKSYSIRQSLKFEIEWQIA